MSLPELNNPTLLQEIPDLESVALQPTLGWEFLLPSKKKKYVPITNFSASESTVSLTISISLVFIATPI